MPPQNRKIETVRRQGGGVRCNHPAFGIRYAAGHGRQVGIAPGEPCRRVDPFAPQGVSDARPFGIGIGPRFGPVIHGKGGDT